MGKNKAQLFFDIPCFYAYKNPVARPKTNPDKHRKNVAITLDPVLLTNSRALAASQGKSLSQILDHLLLRWIDEQKPSMEQLERAKADFVIVRRKPEEAKVKAGTSEIASVLKGDEDPFMAQNKKAVENILSRDKARKSQAKRDEAVAATTPPPVKRRRAIDMEPQTTFGKPVVGPKRRRIVTSP